MAGRPLKFGKKFGSGAVAGGAPDVRLAPGKRGFDPRLRPKIQKPTAAEFLEKAKATGPLADAELEKLGRSVGMTDQPGMRVKSKVTFLMKRFGEKDPDGRWLVTKEIKPPFFGGTPKMAEVFRLGEAELDVKKFQRHVPKGVPPGTVGGTELDLPDIARRYAGVPPKKEEKPSFGELVPQPKGKKLYDAVGVSEEEVQSDDVLDGETASGGGNFYLSTRQWQKGEEGDGKSIEWDGTRIKPRTRAAARFVDKIRELRVHPFEVLKRRVWDEHFASDFGPFGRERKIPQKGGALSQAGGTTP